MLIFHPAAERQHQRPTCFDPGRETCCYTGAQHKQARRNENSIWLPGPILSDEIYSDIATPQRPVVAADLIVIGERLSSRLYLECPEHVVECHASTVQFPRGRYASENRQ